MTTTDLDAVVEALADLRARVVPLILARQERRRDGATAGERLTTPQHITLLSLADGPLAVSEVAAVTGVAVSTATRMVQSLERAGWVERTTPVPGDDRRRRPVALTGEGRAVAEEAGEVVRARLRGLAERLDDDGAPRRARGAGGLRGRASGGRGGGGRLRPPAVLTALEEAAGRATLTTVASGTTMNCAMHTSTRTSRRRSGAVLAVGARVDTTDGPVHFG